MDEQVRRHTAKTQYTENSKQIFPEKELRGHSPNFHIHVPVSDLYIPTIDLPSPAGKYVDKSWEYINRSHTHELWKLDTSDTGRILQAFTLSESIFLCIAASIFSCGTKMYEHRLLKVIHYTLVFAYYLST
jgi:hypothetical protein